MCSKQGVKKTQSKQTGTCNTVYQNLQDVNFRECRKENRMAIIVNTNISALKTRTNLNNATNSLNQALERMSTGYKINSAKDDAAGLYVATGLDVQIRGSKAAQSNAATGINVLQTVEGDLDNILDNLQRIRDLAVQAANSIYDEDAMSAMEQEALARVEEIKRISLASNFNGLELLSGNSNLPTDGLRLQVGANADKDANSILVDGEIFDQTDASTLGKTADIDTTVDGCSAKITADTTVESGIVDSGAFKAATTASSYIAVLDTAIDTISSRKSTIGAVMNRLEAAETSLVTTIENATAAKSTIMDADIAEESAEYTKNQILQQTSSALLVQANALPQIAIQLVQG